VPRFAANLGFLFPELPFLERFAAAARVGFRAVEFADPYSYPTQQLVDCLAGLACVNLNLPMGDRAKGEAGIACLPDRIGEFRDGIERAVAAARALGCPRLNCIAGKQPAGADPEVLRATLVENLRFAARALAAESLTLSLEPINAIDVPGFFVSRAADAAALIAATGEPNVRLQFDCYHMQLMEGDAAAALERHFPLVGHVQFADAPGRHEPGTGTMRYDLLFAQLDRLGYEGWTSAEYRPSRLTEETFGWLPP
jgi:hydroxypyruvate isomerase